MTSTGSKPLWSRSDTHGLVHYSDRGVQYLSILYTERLSEAGLKPSVGSCGDSNDDAMAETVIGLYKAEVDWTGGPSRGVEHVDFGTLGWVASFNDHWLLGPIGDIPPTEIEHLYDRRQTVWPR